MENSTNNESKRLIQWLPTSSYDFDYIDNQEEKTDRPMYNTTYHEPKHYMFVFGSGDPMREINDVYSFKDAVLEIDPYHLPRESLDKLDDTDIDEIIKLFNIYSDYVIDRVYLINEKIYDSREMK